MSKIPKEMGEEVRRELQKVLDEWHSAVFDNGVIGYQKDKIQKIERQK